MTQRAALSSIAWLSMLTLLLEGSLFIAGHRLTWRRLSKYGIGQSPKSAAQVSLEGSLLNAKLLRRFALRQSLDAAQPDHFAHDIGELVECLAQASQILARTET